MGLFGSDITGIDVGAGSVKVVRLASGGRPKLLYAALVELPLEPTTNRSVSDEIRFLLSGKKAAAKNVMTLMPGRHLTIRALTLPKMPMRELGEAVRWEAKRHLSYPLEAAQIEYLVLGEKREGATGKYEILLVAAERGMVVEHLTAFNAAGVKVKAVDANPLALRNVLRLRRKADGKNVLVVDIGAGKTEINIFKGSALRFSRCLETGGADMTRAIADDLGVGLQDAEAVKRKADILTPPEQDRVVAAIRRRLDMTLLEVRRSIEYYKTTFREKGVEQTVLTGGAALMQGIKDYVSLALEGPVEIDAPFSMLSAKAGMLKEFAPQGPRFSGALGLALRKL